MSKHHPNSRNMRKVTAEFFVQCRAADEPCWLCHMAIDYEVEPNSTDQSFNRDHYYPASTHPEHYEDPANFRASHALCNRMRSNNAPRSPLGILSRDWTEPQPIEA